MTVVKAKTTATVMVIRSRFFSTTVEPAAAWPTEPPNMSESPAALTGVHEDEEDQRQRGGQVKTTNAMVSTGGPPRAFLDLSTLPNGGLYRMAAAASRTMAAKLAPSRLALRPGVRRYHAGRPAPRCCRADRAPYWIRMAWADSSPANPATTARMWEQACWASAPVAVTPVPMAQMGS